MKRLATVLILILCWVSKAAAFTVGFDQKILYETSARPLKTSIWYPSQATSPKSLIADNAAFSGTEVVRTGKPMVGKFPLVVISHGYRGNWRNQNWLASRLAAQGYVVASVDHPGTSTFDHSSKAAALWWERPNDISRLLDWLLTQSDLNPFIEPTNITAIGHSLGGWTVMLLAGAQFDRQQLKQECIALPNPRVCGLMSELGLDKVQKSEPTGSLKDGRITRVISLDLGLARSLSRQSLKALTLPVLILAAGVDIGDLPQSEESGFLADYIPKANHQYKVYSDAIHFSFMQLCKPGAVDMIEEENPGDGIVCKDGGERSRQELHQEIYQDIIRFMTST